MKKSILSLFTILMIACSPSQQKREGGNVVLADDKTSEIVFKDYGTEPLVVDIEDYTKENANFRTALWTGKELQLTLMSIPVGGEIGLEVHYDIEQFLRIESGNAKVLMGNSVDNLDFVRYVGDDDVILVPAGRWHNIVNVGDKPLKLYSIYAGPEHPHGAVHKTKADSDAAGHSH